MSWSFDFYGTLQFWAAVLAVALLVRALGANARVKGLVLLCASSALLLALPRFSVQHLLGLYAIAAIAFLAARSLCKPGGDERRRTFIAVTAVVAVVGALVFFKYRLVQGLILPPTGRVLFFLGISYFSFKAIHLVVEAWKRAIPKVALLDTLNYMTFFPSLISGPIARYPHFAAQLGPVAPGTLKRDLLQGCERIIHGLFKKLVLAGFLFPWSLSGRAHPVESPRELALALYASAFYFYFDFAGYSDLAVGSARLLGMELPENFDRPFLQRNVRELWTHWHMSLTNWLVDYIYWPLVRTLRNTGLFRPRPVLLSSVAMTLTFLVCGLWHGEGPNFVLWGAWHGLGISVVTVYQRQKRAIPVPALQRWYRSRASQVAGAVLTFHFFAAGLLLFLLDMGKLRALAAVILR
jgi:alginate O-acetyltransferase complex protein AlgI